MCRVLPRPQRWTDAPADHDARVEDFRGNPDVDISVYVEDATASPPWLILGAFFGHRSGTGPAGPVLHLRFTDGEVAAANGELGDTPADTNWPLEYSDAHRDIIQNHDAVSEAIVTMCEANETARVIQTSREVWLRGVFRLASRDNVPDGFLDKSERRARRLLRQEPRECYLPMARGFPELFTKFMQSNGEAQKNMRAYYRDDRKLWDAIVEILPELGDDSRFR